MFGERVDLAILSGPLACSLALHRAKHRAKRFWWSVYAIATSASWAFCSGKPEISGQLSVGSLSESAPPVRQQPEVEHLYRATLHYPGWKRHQCPYAFPDPGKASSNGCAQAHTGAEGNTAPINRRIKFSTAFVPKGRSPMHVFLSVQVFWFGAVLPRAGHWPFRGGDRIDYPYLYRVATRPT
ncbi:MAG: hypothetical protein GDA36_07255 [Rhodobacteraceae bacterium]|nr:hypothetical protein [Paracoccaceae bacterium]